MDPLQPCQNTSKSLPKNAFQPPPPGDRPPRPSTIDSLPPPPQSFMYANINGLLSLTGRVAKIPILTEDCHNNNFIFLALSESHLNDTSKECEYRIEGYSHILSNRINRERGGVIIYLHNKFTFKILAQSSDNICSFLAIFINELRLAVLLAYRPPPNYDSNLYHGPPLERSFQNIIIDNINSTILDLGNPTPDILLLGDFNFPQAEWCEGSGIRILGNAPESRMLNKLIDTCDSHNLLQKVTFGTRRTPTGESNMLDLIFSNNHNLTSSFFPYETKLSDHSFIICETTYNCQFATEQANEFSAALPPLTSFNLNRANWSEIQAALRSHNWEEMFQQKSCDEKLQIFISAVLEAVERHCPKFSSRPGQQGSRIPRDRRILFRRRKRKLKLLKSLPSNSARFRSLNEDLRQIETDLITSLKRERSAEETKAVSNIKTNPKFFYSFARKHQKIKGAIGPLKVNNELITSASDICESLSTQYSSVFSPMDPNTIIHDPTSFFDLNSDDLPSLLNIEFSEQMIEDEISSLKTNSAPGPDHFPTTLLKSCKREISKPLYLIWRASLDDNDIAPISKHAIVCPALKSGSESYLPKSYRPISLTSHLIKIFEKIIRKAIINHLADNDLLPSNQHGFLQGRSTLSQLIGQVETILRALESGNDVDSIYLDFAKAFDKVDHSILCRKLKEKRIGGPVGCWLHNFLTNRTQQVSANGAISVPVPVLSGVPQGTVLGPILFLIMISDLGSDLTDAFISMFADDSRVSSVVNSPQAQINFQQELNSSIYPWAPANKAVFNGDKFEHVHFSTKSTNSPVYLDPSDSPISAKDHIKDLGVTVSSDLSWSAQIDKVIASCRKQSAWILRTFSSRDILTMRTLWISLIRPLIDYCSPLWSPNPTSYGQIDRLEGVLRSFSKNVDGLRDLNYSERLQALNLHSIQRRHERYKIIYVYKIKEGLIPNLPNDPSDPVISYALQFSPNPRTGCRCDHPNPTSHHNPAVIARNSSFALTASNLWNCLPPAISLVSGKSVNFFKSQLDKFLDLFPDEPRCSASGLFSDPNTGRISNSIWHMRTNSSLQVDIRNLNRNLEYTLPIQGRASSR